MGGLKVHPTQPAAWYEFEMLNADDNTLFMHFQVTISCGLWNYIRTSNLRAKSYGGFVDSVILTCVDHST